MNVVHLICHSLLVDAEDTGVRDTQALLSRCSSSRKKALSPDSDDPGWAEQFRGAQEGE